MSDKLNELLSKCTPENRHEEIDYGSPRKPTSVKVKRLHPDAVIPKKAHVHDAGFDLVAVEDTIIEPGETALIKTGLAFELSPGYEMQIRPRSGVTLKTKLRVQLGTVDSNYRGEVGVIVDNVSDKEVYIEDGVNEYGEMYVSNRYAHDRILINIDGTKDIRIDEAYLRNTYIIRKGDRIAQAIIQRLPDAELAEVEALGDSERGAAGYGSTGVKSE